MIPNRPSVWLEHIVGSEQLFKVVKPFVYQYRPGDIITVPEGFVTDLASTPREAWAVLPPFGNYLEGAVIHDWIYNNKEQRALRGKDGADTVLEMVMMDYGVEQWKVDVIYEAVHRFGQAAWDEDGKKLESA